MCADELSGPALGTGSSPLPSLRESPRLPAPFFYSIKCSSPKDHADPLTKMPLFLLTTIKGLSGLHFCQLWLYISFLFCKKTSQKCHLCLFPLPPHSLFSSSCWAFVAATQLDLLPWWWQCLRRWVQRQIPGSSFDPADDSSDVLLVLNFQGAPGFLLN